MFESACQWAAKHEEVNANYNKAMGYYQEQRTQFLNRIGNEFKDGDAFLKAFNGQIKKELESSDDLDKQFNEIFMTIKEKFDANKDDTTIFPKDLKDAIKESRGRTAEDDKNYLKNYYDRTKKIIDSYLVDQAHTTTRDFFNSITTNDTNNNAISALLYSYARRLLVNSIVAGDAEVALSNYKTTLKGYYAEDVLATAFNNLFSSSEFQAKNTGLIPDEKQQQTSVDILLGKNVSNASDDVLQQIIAKMENIDGTIEASGETTLFDDPSFGIQSKSWVQPWLQTSLYTRKPNTHFLSVGHHSELLPPGGLKSWHEGLRIASENMIEIIGPNVLFSTGHGVDWTADLIKAFRDEQYWLAFYFNKQRYEATGAVDWEHEIVM